MQPIGKINDILTFWFGHVEETIVPSEHRARLWFGENPLVDTQIKQKFSGLLKAAVNHECQDWQQSARGQLALIILLDQFSRHIDRNTAKAYQQDSEALNICTQGMASEYDHKLSLIERVFFYFPLLHSERLVYQEQSVRAYQTLSELAFSETRVIYDSFLKFAHYHYNLIKRFSRFPQRNKVLGRQSTQEEIAYLNEISVEKNQSL